jgi:hypothetical protein
MLNATELLADALGATLEASYIRAFGQRETRYAGIIAEAAKLILERIGWSDALYHSAEHTALVTLVGQDILRGERLRRDVTAEDWLHFTLATLVHDIGYVRGIAKMIVTGRMSSICKDRPLRLPAVHLMLFWHHGTLSGRRSRCASGSAITRSSTRTASAGPLS